MTKTAKKWLIILGGAGALAVAALIIFLVATSGTNAVHYTETVVWDDDKVFGDEYPIENSRLVVVSGGIPAVYADEMMRTPMTERNGVEIIAESPGEGVFTADFECGKRDKVMYARIPAHIIRAELSEPIIIDISAEFANDEFVTEIPVYNEDGREIYAVYTARRVCRHDPVEKDTYDLGIMVKMHRQGYNIEMSLGSDRPDYIDSDTSPNLIANRRERKGMYFFDDFEHDVAICEGMFDINADYVSDITGLFLLHAPKSMEDDVSQQFVKIDTFIDLREEYTVEFNPQDYIK